MRTMFVGGLIYLLVGWQVALGQEKVYPMSLRPAKPDEVIVGATGVTMPMGRFVLARRGSEYCAVKFLKAWQGETVEDQYADYESYCQTDGSGDFSKMNVKVNRERLVRRHEWGIGKLSFPVG